MSAGGTGGAKTEGAGGERDVVDDDEEVVEGEFVELEGRIDGAAGEVHVGLGFEEDEFFSVEEDIGEEGFVGAAEVHGTVGGGEAVDEHEADVVTGALVLGAGVA